MIRFCILLLSLILVSFFGCKEKTPSGILKPEKMQAVLWDVIKADAFTNEFIRKDSSNDAVKENVKLQQQIFAIHKISKKEFYDSYGYYKTNTVLFKNMLDSMVVQAERDKTKAEIIKPLQAE